MTAKSSAPKTHLLYLDGLRALAAIYVVMHHALSQVNFAARPLTGVMQKVVGLFAFGHYSVDVFIVLSGFCLMIPVIRADYQLAGGAGRFFGKRARRILPPYFLAMGLSLLLIRFCIGHPTGTHWDVSIPVTAQDILTHLLLMQDIFVATAPKINHVFWSISVEWRIYFLFPILVACWRGMGALKTTLLSMLAAGGLLLGLHYLRHFYADLNLLQWGICPHYLALFALGMLAADVALAPGEMAAWRHKISWGVALGVTTPLILLKITPLGRFVPWELSDIFVGCWTCCLLIYSAQTHGAARSPAPLHRILSWQPLVFTGTFAYSIYLIHAPLLQILCQYILFPLHLSPLMTFWSLIWLGTPAIIAVAYIFFWCCERPFLNRRKAESLVRTELNAALEPAP